MHLPQALGLPWGPVHRAWAGRACTAAFQLAVQVKVRGSGRLILALESLPDGRQSMLSCVHSTSPVASSCWGHTAAMATRQRLEVFLSAQSQGRRCPPLLLAITPVWVRGCTGSVGALVPLVSSEMTFLLGSPLGVNLTIWQPERRPSLSSGLQLSKSHSKRHSSNQTRV